MDHFDHYYSATPHAPPRPGEFEASVRGVTLRFRTDSGVFSRDRLDPGTRLLLEGIELPPRGDLLDWGAGYGPLGLFLGQLLPEAHVVLVEINERAAELCRENARLNRVPNAEVLTGDAHQTLGDRAFDLIATNPPLHAGKEPVLRLFRDAAGRLRPGGSFWFVARTKQGAKTLARDAGQWFAAVELRDIRSGYRLFRAQEPFP